MNDELQQDLENTIAKLTRPHRPSPRGHTGGRSPVLPSAQYSVPE
ncbi:hypothetical protein [Nocardia tengchongensis]